MKLSISNSTFTFKTGLYSHRAFELLKVLVFNEWKTPHRGYLYHTAPLSIWGIQMFGPVSPASIKDNYIGIAEDGELYFTCFSPIIDVNDSGNALYGDSPFSKKLFIKALKRLKPKFPKNAAGIDLMVKFLKGEKIDVEGCSELYKKYIGAPLDPFKQEALKVAKEVYFKKQNEVTKLFDEKKFSILDIYVPPSKREEAKKLEKKIRDTIDGAFHNIESLLP